MAWTSVRSISTLLLSHGTLPFWCSFTGTLRCFVELYQSYIDCITTPCSFSFLLHYDSFFIKYARIEMCFTNVLPIIDFQNFSILQLLDAMLHLVRFLKAEYPLNSGILIRAGRCHPQLATSKS